MEHELNDPLYNGPLMQCSSRSGKMHQEQAKNISGECNVRTEVVRIKKEPDTSSLEVSNAKCSLPTGLSGI
jgi:hypothetical protein